MRIRSTSVKSLKREDEHFLFGRFDTRSHYQRFKSMSAMGILQQLNFHLHHHPFREVPTTLSFLPRLVCAKGSRQCEGTISKCMIGVIDMARHIAGRNLQKAYLPCSLLDGIGRPTDLHGCGTSFGRRGTLGKYSRPDSAEIRIAGNNWTGQGECQALCPYRGAG
jgi:hypothetical protein